MSEFVECKTKFKDRKALVEGLMALGFAESEIEVHEEAQNLYGYHGDKREQKANIIIRRKNVGGSSNDIGFAKQADGTYEAIISAFDRGSGGKHAAKYGGYNDKFLKDLSCNYTERLYVRVAKEKGYEVKKVKKDNRIVLTLYK